MVQLGIKKFMKEFVEKQKYKRQYSSKHNYLCNLWLDNCQMKPATQGQGIASQGIWQVETTANIVCSTVWGRYYDKVSYISLSMWLKYIFPSSLRLLCSISIITCAQYMYNICTTKYMYNEINYVITGIKQSNKMQKTRYKTKKSTVFTRFDTTIHYHRIHTLNAN